MANGSNLPHNTERSADAAAMATPLRRMLATALTWLERNAAAIDAINVFPVPDGDTGSNMTLTLQAALAALDHDSPLDDTLDDAATAAAAAQGALLGARGNSGVILSQWLRGLAQGLIQGPAQGSGPGGWQAALAQAAAAADGAVAEPREGTMLSVARAAGGAAGSSLETLLADAVDRAKTAVLLTPKQMPLLADAGVVDAGGQGLAVVLEGFLYGLRREEPTTVAAKTGQIDPAWLHGSAAHAAAQGYCTEFVLTRAGASLDAEGLRASLVTLGDSVMVVGDAETLHAHLHTPDPEAAFAVGATQGTVAELKAQDMAAQHATLLAREGGPAVGVVAVAAGEGFAQFFRDLGAVVVVGGATQNPSAAAILEAARAIHAADVIVLPNHPNVEPAAQQAAALSDGVRLHIVPSRSLPGGIAALAALELGVEAADACARMAQAAAEILTGAVTRAARAVERPVPLRAGQPFALLEDTILGGAESITEAARLLIDRMLQDRPDAELLTVYCGADEETIDLNALSSLLPAELHSRVEVEVVIGGQPHYPLILSLE